MIHIKDNRETPPTPPKKIIRDIPEGTVFYGKFSKERGPFLRIYEGIVSLKDPSQTWLNCLAWEIGDYTPVKATLTIENL